MAGKNKFRRHRKNALASAVPRALRGLRLNWLLVHTYATTVFNGLRRPEATRKEYTHGSHKGQIPFFIWAVEHRRGR